MNPRTDYFRTRRKRLASSRVCTRCGEDAPKPGHVLCRACLTVMSMKRTPTPAETEAAGQAAKRKRLLDRLDLIEEARRAVHAELDRINGDAT